MSKIIIFAGTTEGRTLSEWLCDKRITHTVCVATEYGEQVLKEDPLAIICRGRMDQTQMEAFFKKQGAEIIVDATHPYAALVTDNIRCAVKNTGLTYLRLLREGMKDPMENVLADDSDFDGVKVFPSTEACADYLSETKGRIFLTTGSKELATFCQKEGLKDRLIARVLPGKESIAICEELGLPGKQIVAMQGPFSTAMNQALLENYQAEILVTKASGKAGGFLEKLEAAKALGVRVCIIGRPKVEDGDSFEQVCEKLEQYMGLDTGFCVADNVSSADESSHVVDADGNVLKAEVESVREESREQKLQISLIGCGMGHPECLTLEAAKALESADLVFGASRLLRDMEIKKESYPWYLAKDILPFLENRANIREIGKVAILFSGDTGFYSGSKKMYQALKEACEAGRISAAVTIYPGISSIVNLAAKLGESWEDAKIISLHGVGNVDQWGQKLLETVKSHAKTFTLLSGVKNLQAIGGLLEKLDGIRIFAGYQMSYPEEEILELSPEDCRKREKEGLYSLFIINAMPVDVSLARAMVPVTHGLSDDSFIRGKVPMTKEEVRTISISKLGLTQDAVVYDVGSGTGSVAVEIARLSPSIKVYAIERKPEGLELIRQNQEKFGLENITLVSGLAPEALAELPVPSHVFIGGSGGKMEEILRVIFAKNPYTRIVVNAVSFETLQELLRIEETFSVMDFDIVQIAATRSRKLGNYHMTQGENPVWVCSFTGAENTRS